MIGKEHHVDEIEKEMTENSTLLICLRLDRHCRIGGCKKNKPQNLRIWAPGDMVCCE